MKTKLYLTWGYTSVVKLYARKRGKKRISCGNHVYHQQWTKTNVTLYKWLFVTSDNIASVLIIHEFKRCWNEGGVHWKTVLDNSKSGPGNDKDNDIDDAWKETLKNKTFPLNHSEKSTFKLTLFYMWF